MKDFSEPRKPKALDFGASDDEEVEDIIRLPTHEELRQYEIYRKLFVHDARNREWLSATIRNDQKLWEDLGALAADSIPASLLTGILDNPKTHQAIGKIALRATVWLVRNAAWKALLALAVGVAVWLGLKKP